MRWIRNDQSIGHDKDNNVQCKTQLRLFILFLGGFVQS